MALQSIIENVKYVFAVLLAGITQNSNYFLKPMKVW